MNPKDTTTSSQFDNDYPEAWRPEPGDVIEGELVAVDERLGYNDMPYPILTLRKPDGTEHAVHAFHAVLKDELAKHNPQVGEVVAIKFEGKKNTQAGDRTLAAYKVNVPGRPARKVDLRRYSDSPMADEPMDVPIDTVGLPSVSDDAIPF